MPCTCIQHALNMHPACPEHASSMPCTCIRYALHMHPVCWMDLTIPVGAIDPHLIWLHPVQFPHISYIFAKLSNFISAISGSRFLSASSKPRLSLVSGLIRASSRPRPSRVLGSLDRSGKSRFRLRFTGFGDDLQSRSGRCQAIDTRLLS